MPPTVSSISPSSGPLSGGTAVTITGTNFSASPGVTIGGTPATGITYVNPTTITCTTPAGTAGTASVVVTTGDGSNTDNNYFSYVTGPTVTSISPTSGASAGGTLVTINGTNFGGATGVAFRGLPATDVNVVNPFKITCTTPAASAGTASVVVTTDGGSSAPNSLFNFMPPQPTVTGTSANGESPGVGSTLGGSLVTITGTDFIGVGGVTIGGVPATNVTVISETSITCIAPAGSVGDASVVVTTASGANADNALFEYALKKPALNDVNNDGVTPPTGTDAGGTLVTITGKYFTGATGVTIGGVAATHVIVLNDNTLTCITPAGSAGTVKKVLVTTPTGDNHLDDNDHTLLFTYVQGLPTVSSVSPPIGTSAGGISVTITGTHFTGATSVKFGGVVATGITVVNDTTINCITPAGMAGPASVLVTAAAGTSAANSLYLYVLGVPTDTYIYLKGGRGDGFVPKWTGALTEEGMVNDGGSTLGTAGREVSEPYRDIFPSSTINQTYGIWAAGFAVIPMTTGGQGSNFYPEDGNAAANSAKGRVSDEVLHAKPRQYARVATWMIFISQNGLPYKFRKDLVLGWGAQPRSE